MQGLSHYQLDTSYATQYQARCTEVCSYKIRIFSYLVSAVSPAFSPDLLAFQSRSGGSGGAATADTRNGLFVY